MKMTEGDIRTVVLNALAGIAPEVEADEIDPDMNFRDQFDIDSIDFLNLMNELQKQLNVDISEVRYPMLSNLSGCVAYLASKLDIRTE